MINERSLCTKIFSEFDKDIERFIIILNDTLNEILIINQNLEEVNKFSSFQKDYIPQISVFDYLKRLVLYTKIEPSTFIIFMIYIDNFCKKGKVFLTKYNIHR